MKSSTRDEILQSLLDYRGQEQYEDWTGQTVDIDVDVLRETFNRNAEGELVVLPRLIGELLGSNSQVLSVDGLNENVWDEDGDVEELTGVPEQMEWLESRKKMSPHDFSVVAFSRDKDGIGPMMAWLVYKDNYHDGTLAWKHLGVISSYWSMFEEYGIFSNRDFSNDAMCKEAEGKSTSWWVATMRDFKNALAEEAGVIAFTVDFKGISQERFFVRVLNWKGWPEALL